MTAAIVRNSRTFLPPYGANPGSVTNTAQIPFTALSIACLAASFTGVGIHAFRFEEPGNEHYVKLGHFVRYLRTKHIHTSPHPFRRRGTNVSLVVLPVRGFLLRRHTSPSRSASP